VFFSNRERKLFAVFFQTVKEH